MLQPLADGDPSQVGPYRLHGRLGAGGMGVVYQGFSPGGQPVAIKLPRVEVAEDLEFRARFRQEVAAARRVRGSFVAAVLDADVDAPQPWMATEYVDGVSLADAVRRRGALDGAGLVGLAAGLADALIAVHASGVVHRDLKPTNIIMAWDGPKVIDFGIARTSDASARTATGVLVGTVAWMAPEQVSGERAGPAADVFAWGCCVAFAASGRHPFTTDSPAATVGRILAGEPDLAGLPAPLGQLVRHALAKTPQARPTATDLVAALAGREVHGPTDAEQAATQVVRAAQPPQASAAEAPAGHSASPHPGRPWPGWQTPPPAESTPSGPRGPGDVAASPSPPPYRPSVPPPSHYRSPPPVAPYPPQHAQHLEYPPYPQHQQYPPHPRPIPNYLPQAVVLTVIGTFICAIPALPFSIAALVNTSRARSRWAAGDIDGAWWASKKAKRWCIISLIALLATVVTFVGLSGAGIIGG